MTIFISLLEIKKTRELTIRRLIKNEADHIEMLCFKENKLRHEYNDLLYQWKLSINKHGNFNNKQFKLLRAMLYGFEVKERRILEELSTLSVEIEKRKLDIISLERQLKKNLLSQEKIKILMELQ